MKYGNNKKKRKDKEKKQNSERNYRRLNTNKKKKMQAVETTRNTYTFLHTHNPPWAIRALFLNSLELWGVPNMLGVVRGFCVTVVETLLSAFS